MNQVLAANAREHRAISASYRLQARNILKLLKGNLNKAQRMYFLECYVVDCRNSRVHSTASRNMYTLAKIN